MSELTIQTTNIPGLLVIDLILFEDSRGWFKESYQKKKMELLGLPEFNVVQNNFSFNKEKGVTRGLHAEPWEKFISLANGTVFGVWVDLRKGNSFGQKLTLDLSPKKAVFVPRGVANGYQTLETNTTYTYLVNELWSPTTKYVAVNLFDPEIKINWPISESQSLISDKDKSNPLLKEISPMEFNFG